jgi:hypothetical protein
MVIDLTVLRPTPTTPRIATLCRRHLGAMPLSEPPRPHRSTGCTARVLPMVYMSNRSIRPSVPHAVAACVLAKPIGADERGSRYQP